MVSPSLISTSKTFEPHLHAFSWNMQALHTWPLWVSMNESNWTVDAMVVSWRLESCLGCLIWWDQGGAILLVPGDGCAGSQQVTQREWDGFVNAKSLDGIYGVWIGDGAVTSGRFSGAFALKNVCNEWLVCLLDLGQTEALFDCIQLNML